MNGRCCARAQGGTLIFFFIRRLGPSIYHAPPQKISRISSTPKKYLKFCPPPPPRQPFPLAVEQILIVLFYFPPLEAPINLSTCTRHIMTSHIFKEMDLTITCVNMEEMTKQYKVFFMTVGSSLFLENTSSSESSKLRCCYKT